MENPLTTIGDAVAERIKSPILGSYLLSWCIYNWQIWPYTFEATPAATKVRVIAAKVDNLWSFLVPLTAASVVVLVVPFLQAGAAWAAAHARRLQLLAETQYRKEEIDERKARLALREKALEADREALHKEQGQLAAAQKSWNSQSDSQRAGLERVGGQVQSATQKLHDLTREVEKLEGRRDRAQAVVTRVKGVLEEVKVDGESVLQIKQIIERANL